MMPLVEIVTHCFAEKHSDYARALTAQLSSLCLWAPSESHVRVVVFTTPTDDMTIETCAAFADRVDIDLCQRPPSHIFRRGIGRNEAAKRSEADVVWFCDADYLFGDGCLDALAAAKLVGLGYPAEVLIHRAHHLGDAELARIVPGELFKPDLTLFVPKREKFATGGIIIVDGETARLGYMDGTKWCEPADPAKGFIDPREDIAYRKSFCGKATALSLPNVMRFRHSASQFQKAEDRLAQTAHIK